MQIFFSHRRRVILGPACLIVAALFLINIGAANAERASFGAEVFDYDGSPNDPNEPTSVSSVARTRPSSSDPRFSNIQIGRIRVGGPLDLAELKTSDIIVGLHVFKKIDGFKEGVYGWNSFGLRAQSLPSILDALSPGDEVLVYWRPRNIPLTDNLSYYIATISLDALPANFELKNIPRTSINAPQERIKYYAAVGHAAKIATSDTDPSPAQAGLLRKSFPEAAQLARIFVDHLDSLKATPSNPATKPSVANHPMPEAWGQLEIHDKILNSNFYDRLFAGPNTYANYSAQELNPLLPSDVYFKKQGIAELVNEILTYSYEKWYGKNARTITSQMTAGRFNPYGQDLFLTFKGFGRPYIDDPLLQERINEKRAKGRIPAPEYALNYMNQQELINLSGRSDFNTLPLHKKKSVLKAVFDRPSAKTYKNPEYQNIILVFYERDSRINEYGAWRSGGAEDQTRNSWNGRFGQISKDQMLHEYMHRSRSSLSKKFENYQEVATLFRNENRYRKVNFDMTYAEAEKRLSPQSLSTLNKEIEQYENQPSYGYFLHPFSFPNRYRMLRDESYIPYLRELEWQRHVKPGSPVKM